MAGVGDAVADSPRPAATLHAARVEGLPACREGTLCGRLGRPEARERARRRGHVAVRGCEKGLCRGFTLIEITIVILLIGILAALAVPVYVSVRDVAERSVCLHNERSMEYAIMRWRADHPDEALLDGGYLPGGGEAYIDLEGNIAGDTDRSLADYFEARGGAPFNPFCTLPGLPTATVADAGGTGHGPFDCPSNGRGVGEVAGNYDYVTDGLSVTCLTDNQVGMRSDGSRFQHDQPRKVGWSHVLGKAASERKTPLGDTFGEITVGMVDLIKQYYEKNRRYPRSWGSYAYTDIGLDPDFWKKPVDNIIYTPAGSRVKVTPEKGYSLVVVDGKGKEIVLTSKSNWSLWHDVKTGKWYYKTVSKGNLVDVSKLRVVKE